MALFDIPYGETTIPLELSGARSLRVLQGAEEPPIRDLRDAFLRAVTEECVSSPPLRELLRPEDLVTIIVSDITRFYMRQDKVCGLLVAYLHETLRIPYDHMAILIALGTHRPQTEEEMTLLVTPEVYARVRVVNHDCTSPDLRYVGTTSFGTEVYVHPLALGRKVILLSGTIHHLMAGFSGGRKSILPGVCGKSTIEQNHARSLSPTMPQSNPLIGLGMLTHNPVHEDMDEAAALVAPAFGVNIVINSRGEQCRLVCGHYARAWEESCRAAQRMMGVPIQSKADLAVVSCGGYPKDINLYQGVKALFNAAEAVKDGGDVLFLAECREGGGAPDFFGWIEPLRRGTLDEDLRRDFTIAGYIFYAACETMRRKNVTMLTQISPETLDGMNIRACASGEELQRLIDVRGKDVYVLPYGGNTVPYVE